MGLSVSGNLFLLVAILGRKGITLQKIISHGLFWRTGPDTQKGLNKYSLKRVESPISVLWPVPGTGAAAALCHKYYQVLQEPCWKSPGSRPLHSCCSGCYHGLLWGRTGVHLYLRPRNKASGLVSGGLSINVGQNWQARFL